MRYMKLAGVLMVASYCTACSGLNPASERPLGNQVTAVTSKSRPTLSHKVKQATAAPKPTLNILEAIADAFSAFSFSNKQSICANSSLENIESYSAEGGVVRSDVMRWQKATLRLRFTHRKRAEEIFAEKIAPKYRAAKNFSFGGFSSLAGDDKGICTATLIGGNIVLSAGHCVSKKYWADEKMEFPSFETRGVRRDLTSQEFSKLLVVDFDRQLNTAPVASNSLAAYGERPYFTQEVVAMLAPKREPENDRDHAILDDLDYAIFRIKGRPDQIGSYALGADKVFYGGIRKGAKAVVIQHPDGLYKKVSTGVADVTGPAVRTNYLRLSHFASTDGGSSGAAVLDGRGRLVALHVEGACNPFDSKSNDALPLVRIKKELNAALAGKL